MESTRKEWLGPITVAFGLDGSLGHGSTGPSPQQQDPTRAVAPALQDRELLELAARAAGIVIDKSPFNGGGRNNDGFDLLGNPMLDWHNGTKWNPLTDDGDALRLAAKLRILVDPDGETYAVATAVPKGRGEFMAHEKHRGDPCAATRRAIVRAAAEIGRSAVPASEV